MEYVKITYLIDRKVRIDGQVAGFTNRTLMVERGHHKFDLGDPADYSPRFVDRDVQQTTGLSPLIIDVFRPVEA
jgi:hypothetical protein